jgi:6-phosphofructokinase 2
MGKVITLTLNPALDISTTVDNVRPDTKLRCRAPRIDPGGGGVNVSRAMAKLGEQNLAFVALGGTIGQSLLTRLRDEGVTAVCYDIPGETRQSFAVRETSSGDQFRFVLPGPEWTPNLFASCLEALEPHVARGDIVVISGSFPPGLPATAARDVCSFAITRGAEVLVDTSGTALDTLVKAQADEGLTLVMNKDEAERIAGAPVDVAGAGRLARRLVDQRAAETVITTLGALGALTVTREAAWHAAPPDAPIVSKVGAGDSFAAGYVIARNKGHAIDDALRHAMAAATSAVTTPATELCTRKGVERYLREIELEPL